LVRGSTYAVSPRIPAGSACACSSRCGIRGNRLLRKGQRIVARWLVDVRRGFHRRFETRKRPRHAGARIAAAISAWRLVDLVRIIEYSGEELAAASADRHRAVVLVTAGWARPSTIRTKFTWRLKGLEHALQKTSSLSAPARWHTPAPLMKTFLDRVCRIGQTGV
jgi:hypothetical protein